MAGSRYWKQEELLNSLVVDSDGYRIGFVEDIVIEPSEMKLKVYRAKEQVKTEVDTLALRELLLRKVKKWKWFGRPSTEDLEELIRQELGTQEVSENTLVKYAEMHGFEVPRRDVVNRVEEESAVVPWSDIESIGSTELGVCILLKKGYAGESEASPQPRYLSRQEIAGKMVIDRNGRILGSVADLLLSINGPGVRVRRGRLGPHMIPDVDELTRLLAVTYASENTLAENIASKLGIPKIAALEPSAILEFAKKTGVEIPLKEITREEEQVHPTVIPWSQLRKVGDVVLLEGSLEETLY